MNSKRTSRSGFALPAVLAVTGVVTLIFLVAMTALATLTGEARMARDRVAFLERAMTVEATLAYIAATEPIGPQGFNVGGVRSQDAFTAPNLAGADSTGTARLLRLDGAAYTLDLDGPMTVSAQDQAGLINLPRLDSAAFRRLMLELGVPATSAATVFARYQDYVDADDLKTTNGAERADYPVGGPANRRLLQPSELLAVLGVREAVDKDRWRQIRDDLVSNESELTSNLNTATAATLRIRFGLNPAQTEALLAARQRAPLRSLLDYVAITGAPLPEPQELLFMFPTGQINVTIRDGLSPWAYRTRMTLTPGHLFQPIWMDQMQVVEQRRGDAPPSNSARNLARDGADTDENRFPYSFD
jgi:hypothetical protein